MAMLEEKRAVKREQEKLREELQAFQKQKHEFELEFQRKQQETEMELNLCELGLASLV